MNQPYTGRIHDSDVALVEDRLQAPPETRSVAGFVPGPGIERLALSFDIGKLRAALAECLRRSDFMGGMQDDGFAALPLTQRPGHVDRRRARAQGAQTNLPHGDVEHRQSRGEKAFWTHVLLPPSLFADHAQLRRQVDFAGPFAGGKLRL